MPTATVQVGVAEMQEELSLMSKTPLIIMVGADKGGVGKTTVARALDDYLQSRRAARKVFDSERPNGDLKRFTPASEIIDIENVDHQMRVFDTVDGVTLIDVRAGLLSPILRALSDVGLLDDVRSGALALALLHVIGPSAASLREIAETASAIGGGVRHFLGELVENFFADDLRREKALPAVGHLVHRIIRRRDRKSAPEALEERRNSLTGSGRDFKYPAVGP